MSTKSLLAFVKNLHQDFKDADTNEKRMEYNLNTHTFGYEESVFVSEMINELKARKIVLGKDKIAEVERLAGLFSTELYAFHVEMNTEAKKVTGITHLVGTEKNFAFVFTTDVRTGKTPNNFGGKGQGQQDVFDKIKVSYGDAYRKFFFGVRAAFKEGTKSRKRFDDSFSMERDGIRYLSKGQMGQSGHAEGEGIVETMTREFFDKHASTVFNKTNPKERLAEQVLLKDLETLGVDMSFMRSTSDRTFNISLIGRHGNQSAGRAIKAQMAAAEKRLQELADNPAIIESMATELEGSDTFLEIDQKELLATGIDPFRKKKNTKVRSQNTKVKHSKKTVTSKSKSTGKRRGRGSAQSLALKGVTGLGSGRKTRNKSTTGFDQIKLLGVLNRDLPDTVRKNMREPGLVNRTGRFADSVKVTDITQTPQGFPSIGYTYQRDPYEVFEEGSGSKWANGYRDPRTLIDKSIREIATQFALGRFYTRRQ